LTNSENAARTGARDFTRGPILGHVLAMTGTGALGLAAVFLVDFLTLLYVSRMGSAQAAAAVGFASQLLFITLSLNIGLTIAVTAVVSRAIGAGDRARARRLSGSALVHAFLASGLVMAALWLGRDALLALLGAQGEVAALASRFLSVALPSSVALALGMALSGVLRAVGDARRAMHVTLAGAMVTAALDPVLIFVLDFGVMGAAWTVVFARLTAFALGWRGAQGAHRMIARPTAREVVADLRPLGAVAVPAILTNLATPVGLSFALGVFARFGASTVAAYTVVDRVFALAYGPIFALSGSVGAIMGQNLGARLYARLDETLKICFALATGYTLVMWLALWVAAPWIGDMFDAPQDSRRLIVEFMAWGGAGWIFLSWLFVANASFNNLGFPLLSTAFNWGRAMLGVAPLVSLGAALGGAQGAVVGLSAGSVAFGIAAALTTRWTLRRVAARPSPA
jgi:putative MATE family efflux protein